MSHSTTEVDIVEGNNQLENGLPAESVVEKALQEDMEKMK